MIFSNEYGYLGQTANAAELIDKISKGERNNGSFVGAGPGAPDLITVRGKQYLEEADVIIYAGSLVNPQLLEYSKDVCTIHNSAKMTLEEVISVIETQRQRVR